MNWLDIFIIVVLVFSAFTGWRNGIIRGVVTLAGLIIGVVVASQNYNQLAPVVGAVVNGEPWSNIVAFIIILAAVLIIAIALARFLTGLLSLFMLGWVDNAAGLAVGLVVSGLGLTAFISFVSSFSLGVLDSAVQDSTLALVLMDNLGWILGLLPLQFDAVKDLIL